MFAESESDVVAELEMNCNLEKTMVSTYLAWRCPHHILRTTCFFDVNVDQLSFELVKIPLQLFGRLLC